MSSVPTWAFWSIIGPCILLSPVLAFLLAIAVEILIGCLVDAGPPALLLVGAGAISVVLYRKMRMTSRGATQNDG
jgi:hypothetical protein